MEDSSDLVEVRKSEIGDIQLPDWVSSDHFAFRYTGKLRIDKPGKYNFYLNSDDGSRLFLDGSLVVDNDGRHIPEMVAGTIRSTAGNHDLEVQYFEHDGGNTIEVWWAGPGSPYGLTHRFRLFLAYVPLLRRYMVAAAIWPCVCTQPDGHRNYAQELYSSRGHHHDASAIESTMIRVHRRNFLQQSAGLGLALAVTLRAR